MKKFKHLASISLLILFYISTYGQEKKSLAERLGYPKETKLLIIHADDIGLAYSVNKAVKIAFDKKGITSGSIMVPCPWFTEFAEYTKNHPELDVGIHLTLTAEWKNYKWGGVLPPEEISSLLNNKGFFYSSNEELINTADPEEVEKEIKAQIDKAIFFGINPTHLDTHMGSMAITPEILRVYLKVGKEYKIPVFLPAGIIQGYPEINKIIGSDQVLVDNYYMINPNTPPDKWSESYNQIINDLKPGLNELIVHLAIDNEEIQAVTVDHPDYGAAWRQRDLDYVVSDEFKNILEKNNIYCVTWKQIKNTLQ